MSLSSRFIAPSAAAILSTALLFGLSGPAMSQTDATTTLPSVTVQAPKQVARPLRPAAKPQRSAPVAVASRPAGQKPVHAQGSVMAKLAAIERTSSNCADGCQTSFKRGNQPWNGCNLSGGVYSPTCRNVNNFKTYAECQEHGLLLGWRSGEIMGYCTSLVVGGKLSGEKVQVADVKRAGR